MLSGRVSLPLSLFLFLALSHRVHIAIIEVGQAARLFQHGRAVLIPDLLWTVRRSFLGVAVTVGQAVRKSPAVAYEGAI